MACQGSWAGAGPVRGGHGADQVRHEGGPRSVLKGAGPPDHSRRTGIRTGPAGRPKWSGYSVTSSVLAEASRASAVFSEPRVSNMLVVSAENHNQHPQREPV
ncbi:hypothetical protein LWI29_029816 [Acer saccharum]|uniref:Uncharacterized protein n=1 Tax=Acer saccharum TaxID=4024 RepID=A0AA39VJX6_ACESA|nr:hypothetical protein LWI29_029816 [Acer saccharum]